jgi:aminomethyltransferase
MRETPLDTTAGRDAVFGPDAGWRVALGYGDLPGELAAARSGVALADVSHWGAFTLEGRNAVKFLQGLVTNDVAALAAGTGCYGAFLNVHGRIEAVAHIFSLGENRLVLSTPPEATDWVAASLGRFRLAGGFDLVRLDGHARVAVIGPGAIAALRTALGASLDTPFGSRAVELVVDGETVLVLGVPRSNEDGADVVGPPSLVAALFDRLVDAGARPVGVDALEVLAMEDGFPRFGRDFDAETVLQEADVPEIVSFHKGCYLGQEIVARIHFQGQPSKLLRRLVVEEGAEPCPGDEVFSADDDVKVAGRVTSVVRSPEHGPIVFAVMKRKHYALGTPVRVRRGDALVPATVAARGSVPPPQENR